VQQFVKFPEQPDFLVGVRVLDGCGASGRHR
jgi:hypothetical protein